MHENSSARAPAICTHLFFESSSIALIAVFTSHVLLSLSRSQLTTWELELASPAGPATEYVWSEVDRGPLLDTSIVLESVSSGELLAEVEVSLAGDIVCGVAAAEDRGLSRGSISCTLAIGLARRKGMLTRHEISIIASCIFRQRHETGRGFSMIQLQVSPARRWGVDSGNGVETITFAVCLVSWMLLPPPPLFK